MDQQHELPTTPEAMEALLLRFGHRECRVDAIVQPHAVKLEGGTIETQGFAYVLTRYKVPMQAWTIVFRYLDNRVTTRQLDGWQIAEPAEPQPV